MQQILVQWHDEVLKRKSQFFNELCQLLQIESVYNYSTSSPGAPFGTGVAQALEYILRLAADDGFVTKNVDGYAGHVELGQGEEMVGVLAHVDVVSAGNDNWTTPPFSPQIREGKLYARGAIDDKGPLMAAYLAMRIIKELELPLSKRVRLIIGTDEENHWRCVEHYFQQEEMPTMGFTPDAEFPIIIGEKGLLTFEFTGEIPQHTDGDWTLVEYSAGEQPNMVPDLAVAKLRGTGDLFALKEAYQSFLLEHRIHGYAEESNDGLQLTLKGIAHHAFEPHLGLNAALKLSQFLQQVSLDHQGSQYISMIGRYFTDSFFGEKLGIAITEEILGSLTLNCAVCKYRLGVGQKLIINLRYPMQVDVDRLREQISAQLAAYGFRLVDEEHHPIHHVAKQHELIKTLSAVYEEQTGEEAELLTIGGATYARAIDVGVAFGPLFPGKRETAHQRDESIDINDLFRAAAIYAQAIYELAQ